MDCTITAFVFMIYVVLCMASTTYVVAATGCSPLVAALVTPFIPYVLFFVLGTVYDKFHSGPKR